jgi:hypothetical protein
MLMSSATHQATSAPAIRSRVLDPHRVCDGGIGPGSLPLFPCGGTPPKPRDPTP